MIFGNGSIYPGLPRSCHYEREPWSGRLLVVDWRGRVVHRAVGGKANA